MAGKSNNGSGVLVDTWYWEFPGIELLGALTDPKSASDVPDEGDEENEVDDRIKLAKMLVKGQKIPVEVRLKKEFGRDQKTPMSVGGVSFTVGCPTLKIGVTGTDIEALRVALWSMLEQTYKIEWEEYRLVYIGDARGHYAMIETGFSLGTSTVWKGTAPDGSVLMREIDNHNRTGKIWAYKPWPELYTNRNGKVMACIPATEQNLAALQEFRARILALKERLQDLIKPEQIIQTLQNLAGVSMLPAPSQDNLRNAGDLE